MMREVCLSKAKEENFLQVIKVSTSTSTINAHTPSRARRLVVHSGNALNMLGHQKIDQKARSVMCFGDKENFWKTSAPVFRSLPLLRVLDLTRARFEGGKLPSSVGELIHLRFLSLYRANVCHLPSSLRNLKLLLYLNLFIKGEVHVPNILKEMVELRYLLLPYRMDDKTKLELGDLVNLEYLWRFSTKHSSVTDFLRMTKLKNLNVRFTGGCTSSETLSSSLRELRDLEKFFLLGCGKSQVAYHGGDFINLRELILAMHMPKFPDQSRFPPYLARITLYGCSMKEDPMPILEKLLHINSVRLLDSAFVGKIMVCSKGGFPQLCKLQIWKLKELEEWIIEEGSMPCLRTLTINNCKHLKELPDGMKCITSLKELEISHMNKEWKQKLVPGGESHYKVKHIPSVRFINYDFE